MRMFHLSVQSDDGKDLEIDFNEFNILKLIEILYVRRFNKNLGLKFAKIYIESGKDAKDNLKKLGIDLNEVEDGYQDMKKLFGELH